MTIKERILQIAENYSIAKQKFCEDIGLTYGNFTGDNKKRPINSDSIANILALYPDVSPEWLISGRGSMLRGKEASISNTPGTGVPYYDVDFIGGFDLIENDQTVIPAHNIIFKPYDDATLWCNVTGNSMYPKISNGDIIALKKTDIDSIMYGEIYAVVLDTLRTVKILRKSANPQKLRYIPVNVAEYDEQEFDIKRIIQIYAVLGCIHKFF